MTVISPRDDLPSLMKHLQKLCCVDLEKNDSHPGFEANSSSEELALIKQKTDYAENAEAFLAEYEKGKAPLLEKKEEIPYDSIDESVIDGAEDLISEANTLSRRLTSLKADLISNENTIELLTPFTDIEAELPEYSTRCTRTVCGSFPGGITDSTIDSSIGEETVFVRETHARKKTGAVVSLTFFKKDFDEGLAKAKSLGFIPCGAAVREEDGYARGRIETLKNKSEEIEKEIEIIIAKAEKLSEEKKKIKLYIDFQLAHAERFEAAEKAQLSRFTAVLTGWVPEEMCEKVRTYLEDRGYGFEFTDPAEGDDAPILFKNNRFSAQFEPVVELYSAPAYGTFDPTTIMSFFYFIIFGLMLADVGYGILLTLGCLLGKKLLNPQGNTRKMMTMFAICGISCTVMGVLFGGYFSDAPSVLLSSWFGKELPELAVAFNPINQPVPFLAVSLGVGALHLITALGVKFYINWMRGHKFDAVADQGSWIILFLGLGTLLISEKVGLILTLLGVAMLICTQGRAEKNIFMKFVKGVFSLYDIVSYFSDLLSYSRILALGLASMVIGSVFNVLGTIPGFSVVGVIFFIIIFAIGHLLNIAINLLGTFVHASRLQYIEFFGKFYEDGGHMFAPLTYKSKYNILK